MSMPRRPARPVSWVYSPGVMSAWVSPFHLTSFSSTTVRAGMLMPSARVSVANTARIRPAVNSSSTISLNVGSIPAWWAAKPRREAVDEVPVAEHDEVLVGEGLRPAPRRGGGSARPRARGIRRMPRGEQLADGAVAADPAEDEGDRGQQAVAVELLDDLGAASLRRRGGHRAAKPAPPAPPPGPRPPPPAAAAGVRAGGPPRPAAASGLVVAQRPRCSGCRMAASRSGLTRVASGRGRRGGLVDEQVVHRLTDHHVLPQRHRPVLRDDRPRGRRAPRPASRRTPRRC